MADDSIEIIEPFDYHPCNTPRGCLYYDSSILTECQQLKLNELKLSIIKSDEKYLHRHPEVRAFVALITRFVLKKRPRRNVPTMIKEFFDRPMYVIDKEVDAYVQSRRPVEEEAVAEEEDEQSFVTYYHKYLRSLQPTVEEKQSFSDIIMTTSPKSLQSVETVPIKEVTTEEYINQLLLERIFTFNSYKDKKVSTTTEEVAEAEESHQKSKSSVQFEENEEDDGEEEATASEIAMMKPKSRVSIVALLVSGNNQSETEANERQEKMDKSKRPHILSIQDDLD